MAEWKYSGGAFRYDDGNVSVRLTPVARRRVPDEAADTAPGHDAVDPATDPAAATPPSDSAPTYIPDLPTAWEGASPFVLWEWTRYRIEVTPEDAVRTVRYGDIEAEAAGRGIFHFEFANSIGSTRITFAGGTVAVPPLPIEVFSRKLGRTGDPASYIGLYQAMVKDVRDALGNRTALPFAWSGQTAHRTSRTQQQASPLSHWEFLKRHQKHIAEALQAISYGPHRVLATEEVTVPIARARRVSTGALRWALAHPDRWLELPSGTADAAATTQPGWFKAEGRAFIPGTLLQERAEETFDTPENRFVKHLLEALVQAVRSVTTAYPAANPELAPLTATLRHALAWPWLEEVGPMTQLPVASRVLQRKHGYQELYALYPEFLFARAPVGAGLERAIAARNVADLYEYWCFFRLTRLLGQPDLLGPPRIVAYEDADSGLSWRTEAVFADTGYRLSYNKTFAAGQGSYSVELRPDYTLTGPDGDRIVFDTKFRAQLPVEDSGSRDRGGAAQPSDIHKMHTYRDALGVRAAIALYPGERAVFYDAVLRRRSLDDVTVEDLVRRRDLTGVGAIPLVPEKGGA